MPKMGPQPKYDEICGFPPTGMRSLLLTLPVHAVCKGMSRNGPRFSTSTRRYPVSFISKSGAPDITSFAVARNAIRSLSRVWPGVAPHGGERPRLTRCKPHGNAPHNRHSRSSAPFAIPLREPRGRSIGTTALRRRTMPQEPSTAHTPRQRREGGDGKLQGGETLHAPRRPLHKCGPARQHCDRFAGRWPLLIRAPPPLHQRDVGRGDPRWRKASATACWSSTRACSQRSPHCALPIRRVVLVPVLLLGVSSRGSQQQSRSCWSIRPLRR